MATVLGGFSAGNDTVDAKGGDDFVAGDEGNDTIFGGSGWDTLSYEQTYWDKSATHGIKLKVAQGTVKDPWGNTDHFSGFEQYEDSKFNDKMIGSSADDEFKGLKGDDIIKGKGEFDLVDYSKDGNPNYPPPASTASPPISPRGRSSTVMAIPIPSSRSRGCAEHPARTSSSAISTITHSRGWMEKTLRGRKGI